jgi:general secretion pathway protein D
MAENNLDAAGALVAQAEAMGVQYSPLHLGDTPAKARRELDRRQQSPGRSGQLFNPTLSSKPQPERVDPFAARGPAPSASPTSADPKSIAKSCILKGRRELEQGNLPAAAHWYQQAIQQRATFGVQEDSPEKLAADIQRRGGRVDSPLAAAAPGVTPLPPTDQARPIPSAAPTAAAASPATGPATGERAMASKLLLEARRALAMGDVRRANSILQQARSLGVQYGAQDDNPDKIDSQVRAYSDLMAQRDQRGGTEAFRRQYCRLLMDQADGLLRWRELDEAERLATEAARQQVMFSPYEMKPQDLLERVAAARRQARPGDQPASNAPGNAPLAAKQQATEMLRAARVALGSNDLRRAEQLARDVQQLQLPPTAFTPGEDRPELLAMDIERARTGAAAGVTTGGQFVTPATGTGDYDRRADRALYDQQNDPTRNIQATSQQPFAPAIYAPSVPAPAFAQNGGGAAALFEQGEAALRDQNREQALQYFRQAATHIQELDPVTAQRLQDRLQMLSAPAGGPAPAPGLNDTAARQQVLARQVATELGAQESRAQQMLEKDPKGALALLEDARKRVEESGLEPTVREQLLRNVDRKLGEVRKYVEDNHARIELEERNRSVVEGIEKDQQHTLEVQEKVALMVDEFNTLLREQRFDEAAVVAKRAQELDPKNPVTQQLVITSNLIRNYQMAMSIKDQKESGFVKAMEGVDLASIPFNDMEPYKFPTAWGDLTKNRSKLMEKMGPKRSEREIEIQQKLQTPVSLQFQNAPLSAVLDYLSKVAAVNLHIDPRGLTEEGVTTDTPVNIELRQEIKLASALHLILEPLHLTYVIKDDVLKITGEQMRDSEIYPATYNVADLVIPIPNFIPSSRMGLAGAYHDAMGNANMGIGGGFPGTGMAAPPVLAAGSGASTLNPAVLAQMSANNPKGMPQNLPLGFGPGGLGGAAGADFDSLIELITTTVEPTSWDEVGGPGSIAPFETNLSLVISQTQEVHEEIADLLEQLRRLQDLQVTIEVRFITLNDNFFERIGVDFDFDINDNIDRPYQVWGRSQDDASGDTGGDDGGDDGGDSGSGGTYTSPPFPRTAAVARDIRDRDGGESITVGMTSPNLFSADLDIPFSQGSFGLAVPQFGGYDAAAGASLGFAILSDIEAFFFIEAATGDRRSNVLQAPKVTLFNGQTAFVADTSQSPFVMSVIPVVGDFAAAMQPVVVVLSEGTFLSVQAVVSADRRFVRLTVVPFFSSIGEVNTFTFTGSSTTTEETSQEGQQEDPNDNTKNGSKKTTSSSGTTVQLPTFSVMTVNTTVSVPDGGTVLLGGIKRLSEGRNEFGVPLLSKIPYINRLFKNVGIGRETQSLMMMVTPRIIIQEEEEEKLGIN